MLGCMALIKAARIIDGVVNNLGLSLVNRRDPIDTAIAKEPFIHQPTYINGEARRRVVNRVLVGMRFVVQHRMQVGRRDIEHIVSNDHDRRSRWAHVLLGASIKHRVLGHIYVPAQNVGTHVANRRDRHLNVGQKVDALNGLVAGPVNISCVRAKAEIAKIGHVGVVVVLSVIDQIDVKTAVSSFPCFLAPFTGHDVVADFAIAQQVHRNHRVLHAGAALQKQNLVVVRHLHQRSEIIDGCVVNVIIVFATVTEFQDGHSGALIVEHVIPNLFEDLNGQGAGSGREIVDAVVRRGRNGAAHARVLPRPSVPAAWGRHRVCDFVMAVVRPAPHLEVAENDFSTDVEAEFAILIKTTKDDVKLSSIKSDAGHIDVFLAQLEQAHVFIHVLVLLEANVNHLILVDN